MMQCAALSMPHPLLRPMRPVAIIAYCGMGRYTFCTSPRAALATRLLEKLWLPCRRCRYRCRLGKPDERHYNPHYINDSDDIDRPKIAGTACRIASAASCLIRLKKNAPPPITSPSARKWTRFAKTDSKSPRPTIMRTIGWTTIARTGYAFAEAAARSRTG